MLTIEATLQEFGASASVSRIVKSDLLNSAWTVEIARNLHSHILGR